MDMKECLMRALASLVDLRVFPPSPLYVSRLSESGGDDKMSAFLMSPTPLIMKETRSCPMWSMSLIH